MSQQNRFVSVFYLKFLAAYINDNSVSYSLILMSKWGLQRFHFHIKSYLHLSVTEIHNLIITLTVDKPNKHKKTHCQILTDANSNFKEVSHVYKYY